MAFFDKAIAPGGQGKINLQLNTKGYQGNITKTAVVDSNDPKRPSMTISVRVFVKVAINVSPRYITLTGPAGQNVTSLVEIRAEKDKPLTIEADDFSLGGKVAYSIEEIEKGRVFHIRFAGVLQAGQNFSGHLRLKTNYEEKPEITIPIRGYLQMRRGPA